MSVPENKDPGSSPGLFGNLRAFWGVLLAILYTRLDLASAELEETGIYTVRLIILSLAAVLVSIITFFFLFFYLVVLFWEERQIVLGVVLGIWFLASVILIVVVRRMILERPKFFAQTLAELRRDVEGLRPPPSAAKPEESKP